MSCIFGFDFGTKSIGIAVGQPITLSATPIKSIKAKNGVPQWSDIEKLIHEWQPKAFVVGLPLNMDGTEQEITEQARKFARKLHGRFGLPIHLQDERLTTTDAKARLFEFGGYQALKKDQIDAVSAVIILESYFYDTGE
jgi:putative Holliday junction resolvase